MTGVRFNRQPLILLAALIAANFLAWVWALAAFHSHPALLGTALLAYGLGLRHAVDADHIAAIDNVTRKLLQEGKRPIAVGFYFALGHSSVVVVAATAIVLSATALQQSYPGLVAAGSVVGSVCSAGFLFAIAAINLVVLAGLWRMFWHANSGGTYQQQQLEAILAGRGLLTRLLRRLFHLVSYSWHMYPLGLLFGLGFDTASEVGLLGIAASEAAKGLPPAAVLVFPALFTVGMSLVDTANGVLMLRAYGWAFVNPVRKLYYNLTITGFSVIVAVLVGGIEALGMIAEKFGFAGGIWDIVHTASDHLGLFGYGIVVVLLASWGVSALVYWLLAYKRISA